MTIINAFTKGTAAAVATALTLAGCVDVSSGSPVQNSPIATGGKLQAPLDDPKVVGPEPLVIQVPGCVFTKMQEDYSAKCCPNNKERTIEDAQKAFEEVTGKFKPANEFKINEDCDRGETPTDAPASTPEPTPDPEPATGGCDCDEQPSTPGGGADGLPGREFNDASLGLPKDVIVANGQFYTTAPAPKAFA